MHTRVGPRPARERALERQIWTTSQDARHPSTNITPAHATFPRCPLPHATSAGLHRVLASVLGGWAGVTKRRKVRFYTTFMWKRRCRQRASRAGPSTTLLARDLYALPNPSCSPVACLKSTHLGLGGVAKRRKVRFMWSTKTWSTEKGKVKRPVDPCFGKNLFLFFSVISSCILPSADSIAHTYARRVCGAVMLG